MVDYTRLYMDEVMTVIKTTDIGTWRCQAAVNVRAFQLDLQATVPQTWECS